MQKLLATNEIISARKLCESRPSTRGREEYHKKLSANTKSRLMLQAGIANAQMLIRKLAKLAA